MAKRAARVGENNFVQHACPMTDFVNLIAGKWAIPILYRLIVLNAPVRFGELLRAAAPITPKRADPPAAAVRAARAGVALRLSRNSPRVEYQITALGLSMRSALQPLAEWMSQHGHLLKR
ncbi:HxlR-like helix-turn-helix [Raoultella ornithinolytica]|nr:HxlR-like helix-turn-helix [Raoultella ornithinolytica]